MASIPWRLNSLDRYGMDCRVKPGNDDKERRDADSRPKEVGVA